MPSSGGEVAVIRQQTITSVSYVSSPSQQQTIESRSVVAVPCLTGDIADDAFFELMDTEEFRQEITYKNYDEEFEDNMTGGKFKGTPDEYTILGRVEPLTLKDNLVRYGSMEVGDTRIFLPARIRYDSDWQPLSGVGSIRPHKYDEIEYQGITYRIKEITFHMLGSTEVYCECYCTRVDNDKGERWS